MRNFRTTLLLIALAVMPMLAMAGETAKDIKTYGTPGDSMTVEEAQARIDKADSAKKPTAAAVHKAKAKADDAKTTAPVAPTVKPPQFTAREQSLIQAAHEIGMIDAQLAALQQQAAALQAKREELLKSLEKK
jgi:hypothetical protein